MLRFLWLRNWSPWAVIGTWLALVAVFASTLLWTESPVHRLGRGAEFWVLAASALWAVLLPFAYLRDRVLAWIQARERRLDAER